LDHVDSGCSTLSHLGPDWEWWVAIRVEPIEGGANMYNGSEKLTDRETATLRPRFVPRANIELTLTNEAHERLFTVSGPLDEWKWNWNRAIKEGRGEEYQSGPGTWEFRRFDVGPDQAWGTSFVPQFYERYSLCYKIIAPARPAPETAVWLVVETYPGSL
jgi:hypothetical protein